MKNMNHNRHNRVAQSFPTEDIESRTIKALSFALVRIAPSKALCVVALSICCFGFAGLGVAQQKETQKSLPTSVETKQPPTGLTNVYKGVAPQQAKSKLQLNQTGYGVSINNPESNTNPLLNPSQKSIIVIASCNATVAPKDIEAWVGQNNPTTVQNMVASLSGTGRQTITFVVPWGWYYYINVSQQPNIGGIPAGGVCRATAWWTD